MCKCLELIEAELKKRNTEIHMAQSINRHTGEICKPKLVLSTFKIDSKKRGKAVQICLTDEFCHFCGERFL